MKKIPSLFMRNYDTDRLVRDEVVPGSEWVLSGDGVATRKWDGTACMIRDGRLYRRYDVKRGRKVPEGFEAAQDPDPVTGHWPGWIPVGEGNEDRWFLEAFGRGADLDGNYFGNGTYELCGPKVQSSIPNPESLDGHYLIRHGIHVLEGCPRDFNGIREFLASHNIEGIVWHHHTDGRMVKIKTKDFGLQRRGR